MTRFAVALLLLCCARGWTADQSFPLESTDGLRLHNVAVEPATVAHFRNPTIDTSPGR
jgi:hypothetical protein